MAFRGTPIRVSLFISWVFLIALPVSSSDSDRVSLELYYESLCPYSANFVVNYLPKLFENDLISIVDLKLFPWGNAKIRANNTIVCQHGVNECLLNTIEACAIDTWPELSKHFPFIYCVEELALEFKHKQWASCFEKLSLDPKPVLDCYDSGYGKELDLRYAAETDALQPPHEYVPWVVVNGQPLYEDYENFLSYICKAYKGALAYTACSEPSELNAIETGRAKRGRIVLLQRGSKGVNIVGESEISRDFVGEPDERGGSGIGPWKLCSSGVVSVRLLALLSSYSFYMALQFEVMYTKTQFCEFGWLSLRSCCVLLSFSNYYRKRKGK